jgi:predicted ATPase
MSEPVYSSAELQENVGHHDQAIIREQNIDKRQVALSTTDCRVDNEDAGAGDEKGPIRIPFATETETVPSLRKCTDLYGRAVEQSVLLQAYKSTLTREPRSKLVIIKGPPGVGKTRLAESLMEELEKDHGHILKWKFDRQNLLQVAPGFQQAVTNMVNRILAKTDDELKPLRRNLDNHLDYTQKAMLLRQYPPLERLLNTEDNPIRVDNERAYGYDYYVFRLFIQAVCSPDFPTVYLFDDIHWIDDYGLSWALRAVHDVNINGALFVITYNTSVEDRQSSWYKELQDLKARDYIDVTEISLDSITEFGTASMVSHMLGVSITAQDRLATWIQRQTKGNPLYVEEIMVKLYEGGLIRPDSLSKAWVVNLEKAKLQYQGLDTVCAFLAAHLSEQSNALQEVVKVSSSLGYRFSSKLVSSAMSGSVLPYMKVAKKQRIVVDYKDDHHKDYRFTHNSMQEAALSLLGANPLAHASFHIALGRKLVNVLNDQDLQAEMLTVLGQFIYGASAIESQREKYKIAALALRATQIAVSYTSFPSAEKTVAFAIGLLGSNCWREEYDLTLALHNFSAEIAYASGRFDAVSKMVETVLEHARVFDDKLQAYSTKLYMLVSTNHTVGAIESGLQLLHHLGERFPQKPTKTDIGVSAFRIKRMLRGKSDEAILRSVRMVDSRKVAAMQIMNILFTALYLARPMLAPLVALRMVKLTLEHGVTPISSVAFSLYGMLLCSNGRHIEEGARYGDLALKMLDRFQAKQLIPRVFAAVFGFIHGWNRPIELALQELLRGYRVGLETGDIEIALMNVTLYTYYAFDTGKPLAALEQERKKYIEDIGSRQHNETTILIHSPLSKVMRQLMGIEELDDLSVTPDHALNWPDHSKMKICFILCDYENAVEYGRKCRHFLPYAAVDVSSYFMVEGLACLALYKQGMRKQNLVRVAARNLKQLDRLSKSATEYCLGKFTLLEAEFSSLSLRNHRDTVRKYTLAVAFADSRASLFQGAIAHERFGRYLNESGDKLEALEHLRKACSLYEEWNAYRKVNMLQAEIDGMAQDPLFPVVTKE